MTVTEDRLKNIDFTDIRKSAPAFVTIIMMVLTYSITNGIGLGIIVYTLITSITYLVDLIKYSFNKNNPDCKKPTWEISVVTLVVFALFVAYFIVPIV